LKQIVSVVIYLKNILCINQKLKMLRFYSMILLAMLTSACNSDIQSDPDQIINTDWVLTEINGNSPEFENDLSNQPFIRFDTEERRVHGSTSCNRFNGDYMLDEESNELSFSKMASTKMACPDMSVEGEFISMLKEVDHFERNSGSLTFFNSSDESIALFEIDEE